MVGALYDSEMLFLHSGFGTCQLSDMISTRDDDGVCGLDLVVLVFQNEALMRARVLRFFFVASASSVSRELGKSIRHFYHGTQILMLPVYHEKRISLPKTRVASAIRPWYLGTSEAWDFDNKC